MVNRFTIGPNNTKIGLITFANDAEFQFRLNTFNDKDEVIKAISSMPYSTGNTNTHKALEILNKFAFTPNFGGRGNRVPKIAIVITDGSSRQPTLTRTLAIKAKQQGIMMFSIGKIYNVWRSLKNNVFRMEKQKSVQSVFSNFISTLVDHEIFN